MTRAEDLQAEARWWRAEYERLGRELESAHRGARRGHRAGRGAPDAGGPRDRAAGSPGRPRTDSRRCIRTCWSSPGRTDRPCSD
ncbi:hypothetical protein G5V59_27100 [Nocardioides sp. W3-2-3]|uniref:hypothetical protein n=1 Tax=Nocardioides convexus TaxID=2712224 RepID=UPI002418B87C|nr:hypothetical protein [Nocardioides convexus]NHA02061.1 hypothetical protein [Nocardioides convexus]